MGTVAAIPSVSERKWMAHCDTHSPKIRHLDVIFIRRMHGSGVGCTVRNDLCGKFRWSEDVPVRRVTDICHSRLREVFETLLNQ